MGWAVVSALLSFLFYWHWSGTAPHAPDPARGLVILTGQDDGQTLYFSAFQTTSLALLRIGFFISFVCGLLLAPRSSWQGSRVDPAVDNPDDGLGKGIGLGVKIAIPAILLLGPPLVLLLNVAGVTVRF